MDKVAVIIVTYNGMKWLRRCLNDLFQSIIPIQVFIIDNGSQDGTLDFVERHYPQIRLIKSKENLGFGKANNIGIAKAYEDGFDYFFLLNQDGYVSPETIANLVKIAKLNPDFGVLSPIQLNGTGDNLDLNFSILMNNNNCPGFINDSYFDKLKDYYDVKFVMAAFWLITRETIRKIGFFNPVYPHYGEDNDYLNRVLYHGKKVAVVSDAVGLHDREFREMTRSKEIYSWYIDLLIRVSDLNKNFSLEVGRSILFFVKRMCLSLLKFQREDAVLNAKYFFAFLLKQFLVIHRERSKNKIIK
ncbi:glycosyltransferase family 2 protein [Sphingobacterium thalpophilum]|uniref:Glycosyltransferase family 2 protein n=1 Tax=Sphingobacterium thalpophilum TaxID=259 RepID=A0ABV4HC32_9SPHI